MVSCSGIQYLLNNHYDSHRILQQHFFFSFSIRRSMFNVRCSFLVSSLIKLVVSAARGGAEH